VGWGDEVAGGLNPDKATPCSTAMFFPFLGRCRFCRAVVVVAACAGVFGDAISLTAAAKAYPARIWRGGGGHSPTPDDPGGHSAPVGTTLTTAASGTGTTAATFYTTVPDTTLGEADFVCDWLAPMCIATDDLFGVAPPLYSRTHDGWPEQNVLVIHDHVHLSLLASITRWLT
jgi:hypothetical protein